jgi:hypothetical protein
MKTGSRRGMRDSSLIHLKNPGGFDDRRFLLPLGKTLSALAVNVDTGESLAVMVKHGDLPVLVFPPSIMAHAIRLLCSLLFLLHGEQALATPNYYKFRGGAQVTS